MSGTAIIGLGNPLMRDDGFGLVVLAHLTEQWTFDDGVTTADGGTWGLSLLPTIEDADHLILIDAIAAGVPAGQTVVLERDRLPIYLTRKLSPHQIDLRDVLAVAELRGTLPLETIAVGVQPQCVELGCDLTDVVERGVDDVVRLVVERLRSWGHQCEPREAELCTR